MAVGTTVTNANFTGTGVSSTYAPGFYINSSDQVRVYANGVLQTLGDDYVVNNVGASAGCSIVATFEIGAAIYVERVTPITQLVDTQNNETILEDVLDAALDKLTMIAQETSSVTNRALLVPRGETSATLPTAAVRAGKYLAFNALGEPLAMASPASSTPTPTVPSLKGLGAKGDGATNDTAALLAAVTAGGEVYVPDGTYMVDYITVSKKVHIRLANGATLKNRVPANPTTTLDAHWGIFRFVAGSEGSIVEGGTLDGNRAALAPYYNGHTRLGQDNHWWGIRTEFVDDITVIQTKFRNFMSEGFYAYSGHRFRALDVDIQDCGVAFAVQGYNTFSNGCVVRATCRNIGNVIAGTAYYLFQHGITFGTQSGFILDVTMDGFCASKQGVDGVSTGGGKEPVPIGINLYLLEGGSINASVRGYTTAAGLTSVHQAFNYSSVNNCYGRLSAFGFEQALAMGTSCGNTLDVDFDGDFLNIAGYPREGLILTHGGVSPPNGASLAGEAGSNLSSRDNVIRGTIRRFGVGVRDEAEGNDLGGLSVYGNVTDGVQLVVAQGTSGSYPVARRRPSGGRDLVGIEVTANGNAGVIYTGGTGDRILSSYIRDNGQTFGARPQPYNLAVVADVGEGVGLQIVGNDLDATPSVTLANEVSFVPGVATAKPANRTYNSSTALTHTYQVVMRNVNNYRIGEIIRLKAVLSGGLDADGKIIDIDEDTVTLAFASAVTFDQTAVLDNLTGTGSTNGINVTGVGTLFTTEVDFPAYLKFGTEYRRLVYVNSNTSAVIDSPFSSNMPAGTTLQVVRADVVTGIVLPVSALNINGNVTVGPMLLQDNYHPNLDNTIVYTSFPGIADRSRFELTYSLAMTGTALDNAIVVGLPAYTQVEAVRVTNQTAITGVTGSVNIVVKNAAAAVISTPVTGAVLTNGAINRGAIPECPAFQSAGGGVNFVSTVGNPTGTVSARLTLNKLVR